MKGLRDRIRWGGPILLISITLLVADLQQWTGGYGLLVLTLFFGLGACFEALSLRDESAAKKWIGARFFPAVFLGWVVIHRGDRGSPEDRSTVTGSAPVSGITGHRVGGVETTLFRDHSGDCPDDEPVVGGTNTGGLTSGQD